MARGLQIRLACAATLLCLSFAGLFAGTRFGVVHLNAGDMTFVFGPGEKGITMGMAARGCPPDCGFDINWRPLGTLQTGTGG